MESKSSSATLTSRPMTAIMYQLVVRMTQVEMKGFYNDDGVNDACNSGIL